MTYDICFLISLFFVSIIFKHLFIKWVWLIPSSIIAGCIGLFLSEQFLDIFTLKGDVISYIEILLGIIFSSFILSSNDFNLRFNQEIKSLWKYSVLQFFAQWGISLLFTVVILKRIWPEINDSFGLVLPAGFVGGHGTAATVGDIARHMGDYDSFSLFMMMATLGVFFSIIGGLIRIFINYRNGNITNSVHPNQKKLKLAKPHINLITTLTVILIYSISFYCKTYIENDFNHSVPIYAPIIFISLIIRIFCKLHFDKKNLFFLSNVSTDVLVCLGIVSIKILVVSGYILPLLSMVIIGLLISILFIHFLSPIFFKELHFEKSLFTWGWSVGGLAIGLSLVKIISDEHTKQSFMQQFALAYILIIPVEVGLILIVPYLVFKGYALMISIILILLAILTVKSEMDLADK